MRGVKNGPSPEWMQRRLAAIGLRPINALVDITNYITFDRGRPLHVFDASKVKGDLVVRRARDGEDVQALDGRTYRLDDGMVVIADDNGVESIGGIMGGEHTGVDATTTDVLIESALWDPLNIAQTGRKLGIITDARYRFERGVDPAFTVPGLDLATAHGPRALRRRAERARVAGGSRTRSRVIDFPWTEVERLSGLDVPRPRQGDPRGLGFLVAGVASARVAPPSWRPDIEGKADLVEEIIRIAGSTASSRALPRIEGYRGQAGADADPVRTRLAKRRSRCAAWSRR